MATAKVQLQHQYPDGRREFVSQSEALENNDELRKWIIKEIDQRQPIPKGAQWLVCNEKSEYFMFSALIDGLDPPLTME